MPAAALKRRFRGYDRRQTDQLLADLTTRCERLGSERDALLTVIEELRRTQEERERGADNAREETLHELDGREQQVSQLEQRVDELERENAQHVEELRRLREELLEARATQQRHDAEWADHQATLARLEVRERALVEQLVMLKEELREGESEMRALPAAEQAAISRLSRLDQLVESVARETRREAELTLKKARARADEIVRAAESRRREVDAAPREQAAEREPSADFQQDLGEALWTSRVSSNSPPE